MLLTDYDNNPKAVDMAGTTVNFGNDVKTVGNNGDEKLVIHFSPPRPDSCGWQLSGPDVHNFNFSQAGPLTFPDSLQFALKPGSVRKPGDYFWVDSVAILMSNPAVTHSSTIRITIR